MNIIITGSTGFIGKSLTKRLLKENHQVSVVIRPQTETSMIPDSVFPFVDRGNAKALEEFFLDIKPDGVVHLASLFLDQHQSGDIAALVESNITFGTRLLEASSKSGVGWFINTGTFWQHFNDEKYNPVNLYAATKQAFEDIAKYFYETGELNFVTIKLNDTFGPGDSRRKIFSLWRSMAYSAGSLGMSPGGQIIDVSYIENIVDAYVKLIELLQGDERNSYSGEVFCVSSNERVTLKELAEVYESVTNSNLDIVWGQRPYRAREVMVPWTKGKPVPGWKQRVSLEDAIEEFHNKEKEMKQ